jgi:hypothetical protein
MTDEHPYGYCPGCKSHRAAHVHVRHCARCEMLLSHQRWISQWFDNGEIHCCSEEHLTLWLDTRRAIRDA